MPTIDPELPAPLGDNFLEGDPEAPSLPDLSTIDVNSLPLNGGDVITSELSIAAANDFVFFRNQEVIMGGGNTSDVGEPSAHSDRNVIMQTGNWYTAVSTDNGINWGYLDPSVDTPEWPSVNGGFCCDQVVLTKADSDHSLICWLVQFSPDAASNTIRIAVAEGKNDLDRPDPQFCLYDFSASSFGVGGDTELDFNKIAYSNDWLYISSNLFDISSGNADGAVLWRMELDDFAGCGSVTTQAMVDEEHQSFALTLGAGSTMFFGSHHGGQHDELRIFRISDSSSTVNWNTRDISTFPSSGRGQSVCTAPDGNDPCQRFDSRIVGAWTGAGRIGFMWTAAAGGDYPFPHVRVAVFDSGDRDLISEPHIWNDNYAWVYPAVGVNNRGDVAGTVYRIGGGQHPRAYASIWDDISGGPTPWEVHGIRYSNDSPNDDEWGDYGRTL